MSARSETPIERRVQSAVLAALRGPCDAVTPLPSGEELRPVLVAVSGGPDSLALLHALAWIDARLRRRCAGGPPALRVAYFDHGLRDAAVTASERDVVAARASALSLPFLAGAGDVRAVARQEHRSLEDAARRCRYHFLGEAAARSGAELIAVGHTATDQAETVLLRIIRGTGVAGLAGMDWRAPLPVPPGRPSVIRPMLSLERRDSEAYCAALGLAPLYDAENDSPRYLRNRVRHELLPALARLNPRIVPALIGLAQSARDADAAVVTALDRVWPEFARVDAGGVTLDRAALTALPAAVQAEALRRAAAVTGDGLPPERAHLRSLGRLLRGGSGRIVELPGGVRAEAVQDQLRMRRPGRAAGMPPPIVGDWPLAQVGETRLPGWVVEVERVAAARIAAGDPYTAWLRVDVAAGGLVVTGRRPGDRLQPLGMTGEKKLQDLFVDAGVPRAMRDAVPVVRAAGRVAWVVGLRLAGWAAAAAGEPAVRVVFHPGDADLDRAATTR